MLKRTIYLLHVIYYALRVSVDRCRRYAVRLLCQSEYLICDIIQWISLKFNDSWFQSVGTNAVLICICLMQPILTFYLLSSKQLVVMSYEVYVTKCRPHWNSRVEQGQGSFFQILGLSPISIILSVFCAHNIHLPVTFCIFNFGHIL